MPTLRSLEEAKREIAILDASRLLRHCGPDVRTSIDRLAKALNVTIVNAVTRQIRHEDARELESCRLRLLFLAPDTVPEVCDRLFTIARLLRSALNPPNCL